MMLNLYGKLRRWGKCFLTLTLPSLMLACSWAAPESMKLTNNWRLARSAEVSANGLQISQPGFNDSTWVEATVPGTALGSYAKAGVIPDPYFGTNMLALSQSYYNTNYWYRNLFVAPTVSAGETAWLNFDGVNWKADIYLNGSYVGRIDGPFIRGRFDVTRMVLPGATNVLAVLLYWSNATVWDAPTFVASEGWDFMPPIPGRNVGIYEEVFLSKSGRVKLVDPFIVTDLPLPATSPAALTFRVGLTNSSASTVNGFLNGTITPGGVTFSKAVSIPAASSLSVTCSPSSFPQLSLAEAPLWWPNGYGPQNLHKMELTYQTTAGISDLEEVTFGVREYSYDTNGHELYLMVNGQRVMCKGGNWGMPDAMLGYTSAQMDAAVRMHKEMNMTMIRCWHGNSDFKSFYEACDRYGIMVWDEFWLNGSNFGIVPNDVAMFNRNATDKIKRLRNHASLAVWCGENEAVPPGVINDHLKQQVAGLDGTRMYIEASNKGPVHGGVTYSMQTPSWFYDAAGGFTTEIGSPCIPPAESMRAMMPEGDLWPVGNAVWQHHDWDADIGNKNLSAYVAAVNDRYGNSSGIVDFCNKAQLLNYETFRALFEAWNAKMWNDCGGALLWMSKQAWPSTIWQTFDHSFEAGGAFFGCMKACEPVHIQWNYGDGKVRVINNTAVPLTQMTAEVEVFNLDGSIRYQTNFSNLTIPANSPAVCGEILALGGSHLALGRPAVASSVQDNGLNVASNAFDGQGNTRWESVWGSDPQWIYVDLGAPKAIDTVVLNWEGAYGRAYQVQVSDNPSAWRTVYNTTTGNGGQDVITFPAVTNRYVRMYGTARGTMWGYSLYEFEVYQAQTLLNGLSSVHFVKLGLKAADGKLLSENIYWRGNTPLSYSALNVAQKLKPSADSTTVTDGTTTRIGVAIQNPSNGILISGRLKLLRKGSGVRVLPAYYGDNYFFLTPGRTKIVPIEFANADLQGEMPRLVLEGWNMDPIDIPVGAGYGTGKLMWEPSGPAKIKVSWESVPLQEYRLQSTTSLVDGLWTDYGSPIHAIGLQEEFELSLDNASEKYFRLKAVF